MSGEGVGSAEEIWYGTTGTSGTNGTGMEKKDGKRVGGDSRWTAEGDV